MMLRTPSAVALSVVATSLLWTACPPGGNTRDGGAPDSGPQDGGIPDAGLDAAIPATDAGSLDYDAGPASAGYDAGPPQREFVCTPTKWCWSYPYPSGLPFYSLAPDGPSGVWAQNPPAISYLSGQFMRSEGLDWGWAPGPTNPHALQLVPVDPFGRTGRLWAWDNQGIFKWDGTRWLAPFDLQNIYGLFGVDDTHGFVVGQDFTGTLTADGGWNIVLSDAGLLQSVWAAGSADAWLGGPSGLLQHFDGTRWTDVPHPVQAGSVTAIRGASPADVWFVGGTGVPFLWHWDGTQVTDTGVIFDDRPFALAVKSRMRAFVATQTGSLYRWDGSGWTLIHTFVGNWANALLVRENGELWAALQHGPVVSSTDDGVTWRGETRSPTEGFKLLATGAGERLALGTMGSLLSYTPSAGWSEVARFSYADGGAAPLYGAWGAALNDLWLASQQSVFHFDGTHFTEQTLPADSNARAISGSSDTNIWAVGTSVVRYDGVQWTQVSQGALSFAPNSVQVFAADDVLVGTSQNGILHWDGGAWGPTATGALNDIFARSDSDVWGVGPYGYVVHWNGTVQTIVRAVDFSAHDLESVHGSGSSDVWMGGYNTLLHWDGGSLSTMESETYFDHSSLLVTSPNDVLSSTLSSYEILRYKGP